MGIKYHPLDSKLFVTALRSNLLQCRQIISRLKNGTEHLISSLGDGTELSGAAYTAGKGLFTDVMYPSTFHFDRALEDVLSDLDSYASAENGVYQYGALDEDDLKEQISIKEEQRDKLENQQMYYRQMTYTYPDLSGSMNIYSIEQSIQAIYEQIRMLEKQLRALQEFEYQTAPLFKDSLSAFANIVIGISAINKISLDASGNYNSNGADMSWLIRLMNKEFSTKSGEEQALEEAVAALGLPDEAMAYWKSQMKEELRNIPKDEWDDRIKEAAKYLRFDADGNILEIAVARGGAIVYKNGVYDFELSKLAANEVADEELEKILKLGEFGAGILLMFGGGVLTAVGASTALGGGGFSLTGGGAAVGIPAMAAGSALAAVGTLTFQKGSELTQDAILKLQSEISSLEFSFAKGYKEQLGKSEQSLKKVANNKEANRIAQENGFESAETLKEDYVGKSSISKFNMKYDSKTGELILESIKDSSIQVHTGLYVK